MHLFIIYYTKRNNCSQARVDKLSFLGNMNDAPNVHSWTLGMGCVSTQKVLRGFA